LTALSLGLSEFSANLPAQAEAGFMESPSDLRLKAMEALLNQNKERAFEFYSTAIERAVTEYGTKSTFLADLCYEAGSLANRMDRFDRAETYLDKPLPSIRAYQWHVWN